MNITSLQNEKVKYWSGLKLKKNRDKNRVFLIEGDHLIKEAQKKGLVLETISIDDVTANYYVTKEIMQKISNQKSISKTAALCRFIDETDIHGNILICDNLQDPGNLGTLIRSAVAFNFKTIILSDDTVDMYNDKVIRASEGYIFGINIIRKNLKEIIPQLKKDYLIIGTDVINGGDISLLRRKQIAIIIGNEGNGIRADIKSLCDDFVKIKMSEACESLNVAVAGSIMMYEVNHD